MSHRVGGGDDRMVKLYFDLLEWAEVNSVVSEKYSRERRGGEGYYQGWEGLKGVEYYVNIWVLQSKRGFRGGVGFFR